MTSSASPKNSQLSHLFHPLVYFLSLLAIVLLAGLSAELLLGTKGCRWNNFFSPGMLLLGSLLTVFLLVRRNRSVLWTPIPWFLLSLGIFYGLGPLYYILGDAPGIRSLDRVWVVDAYDLWRTNLTVLIGSITIVSSFLLVSTFLKLKKKKKNEYPGNELHRAQRIFFWFFLVGTFVKYVLLLPYQFGLVTFVLPGFLANLSDLVLIALLLSGYLSVRLGKRWRTIFWSFLGVEVLVGLLTLSKTALLYSPLCGFLGIFLARQQMRTLLQGLLVLVLMYVALKPLVRKSRNILYRSGMRRGATLGNRIDIVKNAASDMSKMELEEYSSDMGWWRRLCYSTYHAFAMEQYDTGEPGSSIKNIHYTFVPRLLWPDKPIMTQAGKDFTELVFGHRYSSTGVGVFGEAYWNGGYLVLVLISAYIGLVYAVLSLLSFTFVTKKLWIYMPLVLVGIRLGLESRAWFVPTFIGAIVLYAGTFLMFYLIHSVFKNSLDSPVHKQGNPAPARRYHQQPSHMRTPGDSWHR